MTPKQKKFTEVFVNGTSQSQAYRTAYYTQNMSQKTVWEESSRLRKHPKVAARIIELEVEKEARRRMQALSREDRVLKELEEIAYRDGPISSRLRALELLGKHIGLFKTKELPVIPDLKKRLLLTFKDALKPCLNEFSFIISSC